MSVVKKTASCVLKFSILIVMMLAACAPADLDVTPTATPTDVPSPTPTPAVTATPTPIGSVGTSAAEVLEARVDAIVANVPQTMPSGAVQWRLDFTREPEVVRNVTNGIAKRVFLTEAQGGRANLTFGVFDTAEDAFNYYEFIRGLRTVLENGQTDGDFPQPNLFGSGLYGSNAIFQLEDVFVEVSVEAFSSTAGNPLPPLSRNTLEVVEGALLAAPDEADLDEEAAAANSTSDNASTLDAILAAIPDILPGGAVQWRYDRSAEPQPVEATNGVARRVRISDPGGAQGTLTYGVFESAEDAEVYYEFVRGLRTVLENGQTEDDFPQPNLFGSGLYGSNAIFQMDNVFVEVSVEQFPSTAGNPLPGLSRQALGVVEEGLAVAGMPLDDDASEEATLSLDAIVAELPETVSAGGIEWERGAESLDNTPNGSAIVVPFTGAGRVRVFLGLFDDEADASAYSPRLSGGSRSIQTILPAGGSFIAIIVDAGESEAAAPGLMSAVLSALDAVAAG